MKSPLRALLALAGGALAPLALAPFGYWPLGLLAFAIWWWLLHDAQSAPRPLHRAAWWSWCWGLGQYAVGVSWVYVSIHVHGRAAPVLAASLVVLFVSALALFPLAAGLAHAWVARRLGGLAPLPSALLFALCVAGLWWLLTWFLTGFPWLFLGDAFVDSVFGQGWLPVLGVLATGLLALASALGPALVLRSPAAGWRHHAACLGVPLLLWSLAAGLARVDWVSPDGRVLEVALVQGNIAQESKWRPEQVGPILATYQRLSRPVWGADLVVWPEAALTLFHHQAGDVLAALGSRAGNGALLLGLPAWEVAPGTDARNGSFRNTALVVGNGGGRYLKQRLVPFGEYVPLEGLLRGLISFFDLPMSRAGAGPPAQPPLRAAGLQVGMAICYEIAYPGLVRDAARQAQLLATLSNDTWFGDSIGPLQHLGMARTRALETGRWVLRATNNGVTAVVDPRGRLVAVAPRNREAVLRARVQGSRGLTPWVRWGNAGLALLCVGLALLVLLFSRRWRVGASAPG